MTRRTIIIGDVHGCFEELQELLLKLEFHKGRDRLVFVGDLVDRGPEPLKVIKMLRELDAECTIGNHDERYLRYRKHMLRNAKDPSYVIPMKAPYGGRLGTFDGLDEDDWHWLSALPPVIKLSDKWSVIHAGLEPGIPLERQYVDTVLHARYIRKSTGKYERNLGNITAADACFWTELWDGPENIIYGHMITSTRMPFISISAGGALCVGIDTGCCFGGALTAMILDSDDRHFSFVSVKAKKSYDEDIVNYTAATTLS